MFTAVTTATGGLRTQAHILHRLHAAAWSQLRATQLPQTTSRRCLSTTSGRLTLEPRDIGTCPAEIPPVISFKKDLNTQKKAVISSTKAVGVKLKITTDNTQSAKKAQKKKAEAVDSKLVKKKKLKVTSGEPLSLLFSCPGLPFAGPVR